LAQWRKNQIRPSDRKLIIHANSAGPHISRISLVFLNENDMTKAPPPPYALDLAPSDFVLFARVKQLLRGAELPDRHLLFDAIVQILNGLEKCLG
jgi:hypothetical protein